MNSFDPSQIPLRDLHLPEKIGWWPLAPGWWFMAALLVVLAVACVLIYWRWRRYRLQRVATAILDRIQSEFERTGDGQQAVREISVLLRRITLALKPTAASFTNGPWLSTLEELGTRVPLDLESIIASSPYQNPATSPLAAAEVVRTIDFAREWIMATQGKAVADA